MTILSVEPRYTFEFQLQAQESNKKPYTRKAYEKYMDNCFWDVLSNIVNDIVDTNQTL